MPRIAPDPRPTKSPRPAVPVNTAVNQPDNSVKSAERTVRILEELATAPTRLTISELQQRLGYPRSSLHALIRTLRELRWVETDDTGSAFGLGAHALIAGTSYLDRDPALPYVHDMLEDLRAHIGYTVHYARRDGAHVIYLASREARAEVRRVQRVGRRLPAHLTALGQVLLAGLTPHEVASILPDDLEAYTPHTITDRPALDAELAAIRARGWAFEREQGTAGIACVAAAVDYRIPATDAVSCSVPLATAHGDELDRVVTAVVEHARSLATTLRHAGIR